MRVRPEAWCALQSLAQEGGRGNLGRLSTGPTRWDRRRACEEGCAACVRRKAYIACGHMLGQVQCKFLRGRRGKQMSWETLPLPHSALWSLVQKRGRRLGSVYGRQSQRNLPRKTLFALQFLALRNRKEPGLSAWKQTL